MKLSFARATMAVAATLLLATGCETAGTNKAHADWQAISDETTTGKPEVASATSATGQPPVPGSPTAAGPDGLQPANDDEARQSPGTEGGRPTPPAEQKKDSFQRQ